MKRLVLASLMFALVAAPAARAQEPDVLDEVVELDTTLVEVPVVVSEPGGRYVTDLTAGDFAVFENGEPMKVDFFAATEQPFNVALMLDTSGSTRDRLERIKEAAAAFIDQLRPHDRVALVAFEEEVRVLTPLTSDRARLRRALGGLQTGQFTQVYEAMQSVAEDLLGGVEGRKAAIVFTDGVDTASYTSLESSLEAVARHQILVYPVRFNTRPDVEARLETRGEVSEETRTSLTHAYRIADSYLRDLATRSGGTVRYADRIEDLPRAFAEIAAELRHQYLVGYYPPRRDLLDSERRITVTVSRPGLVVRSRQSYRAARP
jgi:Ca-activated chloride channel family protein